MICWFSDLSQAHFRGLRNNNLKKKGKQLHENAKSLEKLSIWKRRKNSASQIFFWLFCNDKFIGGSEKQQILWVWPNFSTVLVPVIKYSLNVKIVLYISVLPTQWETLCCGVSPMASIWQVHWNIYSLHQPMLTAICMFPYLWLATNTRIYSGSGFMITMVKT